MKLLEKLLKKTPRKEMPAWLRPLEPGDIAIDCGANVGTITVQLAQTGATVYAFEPNPYAFARLKENTARYANVICYPDAVSTEEDLIEFYMHVNAGDDPLYWSQGSSALKFKSNVNPENFILVKCIDIISFVKNLNQRVAFFKMDIEGAECPIIKQFIETGLIHDIDQFHCEMHDKKIPELREASDEIRRLVNQNQLTHVNLDWV